MLAGSDKNQADTAVKTLKAGQVVALVSGSVREVGPLTLPLFVQAPHSMAARQAIAGTPFEVVAVTSTREAVEALAAFQLFGVAGLAGLALLTLVVALLLKPGEDDEGGGMVVPPPMPLPPVAKKEVRKEPEPIHHEPHHHGPEASPDDFHFPASTGSNIAISTPSMTGSTAPLPPPVETGQNPALSVGLTSAPPAFSPNGPTVSSYTPSAPPVDDNPFDPPADPFAVAAPASRPASPPPQRAPKPPEADDPSERTVAYPVYKPDPLAVTPSQSTGPIPEDSPDATRVAAVPQELIKAARSASGTTGERPAVSAKLASMPKVQSVAPAAPADAEERHFHDVFREFVSTREKCGEPADGLTYEKFKGKLLKNKEQLVSKYQCRTVRFQVYVKEGKAALKATPVKD
jgi:hypothetical protein